MTPTNVLKATDMRHLDRLPAGAFAVDFNPLGVKLTSCCGIVVGGGTYKSAVDEMIRRLEKKRQEQVMLICRVEDGDAA